MLHTLVSHDLVGMLYGKRQVHVENLSGDIRERSMELGSLVPQTTSNIDEQNTVGSEFGIAKAEILFDWVLLDPGRLILAACGHVDVEVCKVLGVRHHPFEAVLFRVAGLLEDCVVAVIGVLVAMTFEPGRKFLVDRAN